MPRVTWACLEPQEYQAVRGSPGAVVRQASLETRGREVLWGRPGSLAQKDPKELREDPGRMGYQGMREPQEDQETEDPKENVVTPG